MNFRCRLTIKLTDMIDRLAYFASKEEFEDYFNFFTGKEAIFEPHYNLAPAHEIPILIPPDNGDGIRIVRARWSLDEPGHSSNNGHNLSVEQALEKLGKKEYIPCIVAVSGFYIWKNEDKKEQPFFVRMLNESIMSIGILKRDQDDNNKLSCAIITTEANALIQPIAGKMPLLFTSALAKSWLRKPEEVENILIQAEKLFLLTEMTVHRVSKKVSDPRNNDSKLIQPIPK